MHSIIINKRKIIFDSPKNIFFTSDTHFGHKNIIKYCNRPFSSIDEMNEKLIENWNKVVSENDIVFHLGDFALGGSILYSKILSRLKGSIHLVLGNHDTSQLTNNSRIESVYRQALISIEDQQIYLNHYPFLCYSGSNHNVWQLFGHVHSGGNTNRFDIPRLQYLYPTQYDVGVDNNNYYPVSWSKIKEIISKQIANEISPKNYMNLAHESKEN